MKIKYKLSIVVTALIAVVMTGIAALLLLQAPNIIAVTAIQATAAVIYFTLGFFTKPIVTAPDAVGDISEGEGELTRTIPEIRNFIDGICGYTGHQSASLSQSYCAIEEMFAGIKPVPQTLVKNGESVNELSSASEPGLISLQEAAADIQEIARDSERPLEIKKMMKDAADLTNPLSMNAATEKVHAGDSGIGFEVVAGDICKEKINTLAHKALTFEAA